MKHVAIFGPTKNVPPGSYERLCDRLGTMPRPFVIITSTCSTGWDEMARRYAREHDNVFLLVIKADMTLGYDVAVRKCNEWMAGEADEGITQDGVNTPVSLDMVKRLEKDGKRVVYV